MSFLTLAYQWGWVKAAQLQTAVAAKTLTADQYKTITGTDYAPATTGGTT